MTAFGLPYRRALDFFGARSNQTSKSLPKHDPLILGLQTVPSAAFTSTPSRCIESADRTANDGLAKAATLLSAFSHEGTNRRALAENGCSDLKYSACGRQLPEEYLVKLREAQIIWILSDLLGNLPKRPSRYGKLLDDPLRYLSELRSHAKANERLSRYADLYRQWWSTAFFTSGDDVFYSLLEDMRRNVVIAPVTGLALSRRTSGQLTRALSEIALKPAFQQVRRIRAGRACRSKAGRATGASPTRIYGALSFSMSLPKLR